MDVSTSYTASSSPAGSSAAKGLISSDFTTFLKMLTTQMQNQDPLNPIDSTDYAVQLATFSGVEQQVQTNQLLQALSAQFSVMGMSQLAGWVGQEARAAADVWYTGQPVELAPNPRATADQVVLVVRDVEGKLVAREALPFGTEPYHWFGQDAQGNPLPEGRYKLSLESRRNGEVLGEDPMEYYGHITEARGANGGVSLVFDGKIEVSATAITALRSPQAG
ncbi:flagellar hook capping FlgD N-terminal domain-containing protein [Neotabrizicola sp. sgz301269]|uniref:flagellar hook capping FlgD N-terminal domain-containing protein n=1 Tax=Neotabrizicola sp. sgz301269 TaxID=3276282 RepID=UPI0037700235